MRELTVFEVAHISGGISTSVVAGAAIGGVASLIPAYEFIATAAGMLPFTSFVVGGIPMILKETYPLIIAGMCIGGFIGASYDYLTQ